MEVSKLNHYVWLINLFGTPCTPTSFNPDNSLAALAGSLKQAEFRPLIIDYQTLGTFRKLVPEAFGKRSLEIAELARANVLGASDFEMIKNFNDELTAHQLGVVDRLADDLIAKARRDRPIFIGLKLYSGEGSLFNRRLVQRLKMQLEIPIVAGGPLIRVVGRKYLDLYPEFDYLLNGECDWSIVAFAKYCLGQVPPTSVKGLIYRDRQGGTVENPPEAIKDLGALPDPCYDRDVYPSLYEPGEKILSFQLDESRGCPNQCHFCVHPAINGRQFRAAPVEKIIGQIKYLQKTFGAYAFRFAGSNTPKKFLREFAEAVIRENLDIKYSCFASINTTDVAVIEPLRRSGMAGVFIGVEALDPEVLKRSFNKHGQPAEKIDSIVRGFLDAGIFTVTSWIYPAPFATPKSREMVKSFITDVYGGRAPDQGSVLVLPPALVPGTAWFRDPSRFGFTVADPETYYKGYVDLIFKVYLPAQLMGTWNFKMHGKTFNELGSECDRLRGELNQAGVPQGFSDDWMLIGKLSGMSMNDFYSTVTRCFLTGEADRMRSVILTINENSRHRRWAKLGKPMAGAA